LTKQLGAFRKCWNALKKKGVEFLVRVFVAVIFQQNG